MNLYKKNILKHVMPMNPRRHHKYLYIDANGNYVYPKDIAKKAGNKARDLNAQGQANAVNVRKERAERIKAGNNRMVAKLKGIYDQGQANNVNAHKARAESINAGNERITNSKAYKVGKTILGETKAGKELKRLGKYANNVRDEFTGVELPKGNKVKPRQKTPEEIAREDAELERRVSEGMTEFAAKYAEDYYKEQPKKKAEKLPEGWVRDQNGYVYDDIRAMAIDPNDPAYKKKKKRAKKSAKKLIKTSVAHSDTYRSNAMNSHQRKIYSSQIKHGLEWKKHKYLYKDANGNYVYPEDVAGKAKSTASNIGSMATAAGTAAKTKISNTIADQKTKLKDKKYLLDENRRKYPNLEKANVTSPGGKRVNQITSAHQEGTKKTTALSYQSTHDPISNKVVKVKRDFDANGNQIGVGYSTEPSHLAKKKHKISGIANSNQIEDRKRLEEQKRKEKKEINDKYGRLALNGAALDRGEKSFQERRYAIAQENDHWKREQDAKRNYKTNKQRKSDHAGYEADKKAFPEGGSTEELERQKEKTTARKTKVRTEAGVEAGRDRVKKKKKKPTVKGSKKVTTWDNANVKRW